MSALDGITGIMRDIRDLAGRLSRLESHDKPQWIYLAAPLTSTSWDGDAYSTTAKTKIDLSSVFSAPAGIKAISALVSFRDVASAGSDVYIILSPNDTAGSGPTVRAHGRVNDAYETQMLTVPCDANGDIYYQIAATGAGTADVWIAIWGYLI